MKFSKEINARVTGVTVTTSFHFFALEATLLVDSMDLHTADTQTMAAVHSVRNSGEKLHQVYGRSVPDGTGVGSQPLAAALLALLFQQFEKRAMRQQSGFAALQQRQVARANTSTK